MAVSQQLRSSSRRLLRGRSFPFRNPRVDVAFQNIQRYCPAEKHRVARSRFVESLGEACTMTGWRVHAWVLLSNHYHLMIETPEPNLVEGMKWLQNTVTRRLNAESSLG